MTFHTNVQGGAQRHSLRSDQNTIREFSFIYFQTLALFSEDELAGRSTRAVQLLRSDPHTNRYFYILSFIYFYIFAALAEDDPQNTLSNHKTVSLDYSRQMMDRRTNLTKNTSSVATQNIIYSKHKEFSFIIHIF